MTIQRKWRRDWQKDKTFCTVDRAVVKKNNALKCAARSTTKLLPPVAAASLLIASMILPAYANPTGGQITFGAGNIAQSGSTMTITQNTNKMSVNWQSFNIAPNETVNFIQPGAASIALNRVLGNNASSIYGHLNANGQVFLINPNGVLFARGAQVNVGGLVASTLNLSDKEFQAGNYRFSGSGGSVVNQGAITAANGGYVSLLGSQVSNQGVIAAQQGAVALGAGNAATLDFNGDGLLSLAVNQSTVNALAENKNLIQADGGQVIMTARAADALTGTVVNNSGVIRAKSINNVNGVILLDGGTNGTVSVSGTLDASGKNTGETGGTVKALGEKIELTGQALLDASGTNGGGTILVGGNCQGQGPEQNAKNTKVEQGTVLKADAISQGDGGKVVVWADDTTNFAGTISAKGGSVSGNGGRVETSGKATLSLADTAKVITTASKGKTGNWLLDPTNYTIGTGVTGANYWNNTALGTALGSSSITVATNNATGTDAGNITVAAPVSWSSGNTLTLNAYNSANIYANITATGENAGLALTTGAGGYTLGSGAVITLSGNNAGFSLNGTPYTVINNHSTGGALQALQNIGLSGKYFLGVDINAGATADSSYNAGHGFIPIGTAGSEFTGTFDGGGHTIDRLFINPSSSQYTGLFGFIKSGSVIRNVGLTNITVENIHSMNVGGLVGYNYGGNIMHSYSMGTVSGDANVGGLVGDNFGRIEYSYSAGTVSGSAAGGLVGKNDSDVAGGLGTISNSYSTGTVSGDSSIGGLVGDNSGHIEYSYSTGTVSGGSLIGGLVGENSGSITDSCWNKDTNSPGLYGIGYDQTASEATNTGATGLTTAQMKQASSYNGWNMAKAGGSSAVWRIYEGYTYPLLRSFLTPLTITAKNVTKTCDGATYNSPAGVTYSTGSAPSNLFGNLSYTGAETKAGTYTITPTGLYSNQQGYDISYAAGTLTLQPITVIIPSPLQDAPSSPTPTVDSNLPSSPTLLVVVNPSPVTVTNVTSSSPVTVTGPDKPSSTPVVNPYFSTRVVEVDDFPQPDGIPHQGSHWGETYKDSDGQWWYWQKHDNDGTGHWTSGHGQGQNYGDKYLDKGLHLDVA